jgi:protein TonB
MPLTTEKRTIQGQRATPVHLVRVIIVTAVCLVHLLLLFYFGFTMNAAVLPVIETGAMRLVNIMEQMEQEEASVPLRIAAPPARKAAAEPLPALTEEKVAEELVESTELPHDSAAETAPENAADAQGGAVANRGADAASAAAAYVKKNFDYIQRRIRDKLVYPPQAKRLGVQGKTEALFTIHKDGTVSGVTVRVSSGNGLLDKAAIDAIYAAAPFRPAPPSEARLAAPVVFSLR